MRVPDERKRKVITETAAKLFATQPFHKVRLDDIAAAAGVGKGTVYIYFDSKEDLYYSLIYDGFVDMVERLRRELAATDGSTLDHLRTAVREIVNFATQHPQLYEVMRTAGLPSINSSWDDKRREMTAVVEDLIRKGIAEGILRDPDPHLTALFVPGMVRAVMMYGDKTLTADQIAGQMLFLLENGMVKDGVAV